MIPPIVESNHVQTKIFIWKCNQLAKVGYFFIHTMDRSRQGHNKTYGVYTMLFQKKLNLNLVSKTSNQCNSVC